MTVKIEFTRQQLDEMKKMYENGMTQAKIGEVFKVSSSTIKNNLKALGVKSHTPYKPYLYRVGEVVNDTLKIVELTRMKNGKATQKGYIVQSLIYSTAETYEITEGSLKKGQGCAYVAGRRVCEENSLWSIKNLRSNIINVKQAKNITKMNDKKIRFKCSSKSCNVTKIMTVSALAQHGFSCPQCSTGISYPERFMLAINEYFSLNFEYQQTYENGRFDFINHTTKIVVEMNGRTHYEDTSWDGSHEATKLSDNKKRKWCKENGYTLIFIDARKSEFEFIRNNINKEPLLSNIKKEDEKVIMELIEMSSKYDIAEIIKLYTIEKLTITQIGKRYNTSHTTINNLLARNGIKRRRNSGVPRKIVKCIETGIVYQSGNEAMRKTGIDISSITKCCNGKLKSAGGYHWEFVD